MIFFNYRRVDCSDSVARLHQKLKARLRNQELFYDHQSLELGTAFPSVLHDRVTSARVVLVCIGRRWLSELRSRPADKIDFVREEIRLALDSTALVIPVLLDGAKMPAPEELAEFPDLLPLCEQNAKPIRPDPDFDHDADQLLAFLERTGPTEILGTTLSNKYKVLRLLSDQGGMGDVYIAEQSQPERRDVAIKVVKPGMDSREILARFESERQALALLDHVNICRVFDGGMTPTGRSFFAMEYIRGGVPITEYCDRQKLTPAERITLFLDLCRAIQHAHQKGIVHRDLKPGNVLVTVENNRPIIKVIDFGLAKSLGGKLTERSFAGTQTNTWVGTPEYASPEQVEGRYDIDTLTDVYSLGVLLYELLAGSPPFTRAELLQTGEEAMKRMIREQPPSTPSMKLRSSASLPTIAANCRLEPAKLTKSVEGDLDWILLKTLEKDRTHRYATPTALADDLQRHLNNEPISVGAPTAWQRWRKFYRRNRGQVLAAAAILAILITGIAATTWAWGEAVDAQQRVIEEADRARRSDYANRIALAEMEIERNNLTHARTLLNDCPADLRHFEWHRLNAILDVSVVTLRGDQEFIDTVAVSADGQRIVSGSRDKTIKVWDAKNRGEALLTLRGHVGPVLSVALSADGRRIVSGSDDQTIKVWDAEKGGEALLTLRGHKDAIQSIAISADGCRIMSGSMDKTIKVWDAQKGGETLLTLRGHVGSVYSVAFSADGRRIVSGSGDHTIKVWDAEKGGEALLTLRGHGDFVYSVAISADGRRIVSGSEKSRRIQNKTIQVWDAEKGGEALLTLRGHVGSVNSVAFSADGRRIVSGSDDQTIKVWDAEKGGEALLTLRGHELRVSSVALSADGRRIVSGSHDSTIKVWDAENWGEALCELRDNEFYVKSVAFSADGRRIVSQSGDNTIKIWEVDKGGEPLLKLRGSMNSVNYVAFSADGRRIVSGGHDMTITVWDAKKGGEALLIMRHVGRVNCVAISVDCQRIVSGNEDNTIKIWDAEKGGTALLTLRGHKNGVFSDRGGNYGVKSVAFSADGRRIVSGGGDNTIKVWDAEKGGEALFTLRGHESGVEFVAMSADGRRIVSRCSDNKIKVWDAENGGEALLTLRDVSGLCSVAFSADGRRIVTGSNETIKLWDAEKGGVALLSLRGHERTVSSVAISADGRRIVSGSEDKTIRIWNTRTGSNP